MSRVPIAITLAALAAGLATWQGGDGASSPAQAAVSQSFTDAYACYLGQFSGFRRPAPLTLADLLARRRRTMPVGPPYAVCAPASSGVEPRPRRGYLVCYPTTAAGLGVEAHLTSEALGSLALTPTSQRDLICVESDRVVGGSPERRSTVRRFVCYRSGTARRGTRRLRIQDVLRGSEQNAAGLPYRGCAAAGETLPAAATPEYIVCSTLTSKTPGGSVVLYNKKYGYLKAALGPRSMLCIPATD